MDGCGWLAEIIREGVFDDETLAQHACVRVTVPRGVEANSAQRINELLTYSCSCAECVVGFHSAEPEQELASVNHPVDVLHVAIDVACGIVFFRLIGAVLGAFGSIPAFAEAEKLGCVAGVHSGGSRGAVRQQTFL